MTKRKKPKDVDRDSWCTPKSWAERLGGFDLDPCSNDRSHVDAIYSYRIERGENGLKLGTSKWMDGASVKTFINPPYSDVMPWITAFKHTRFCFLLKFDTSTKWFHELYRVTGLVCVTRKRIAFEPPPGVKGSSNQFPHAFFYRHLEDAPKEILSTCIAWRTR